MLEPRDGGQAGARRQDDVVRTEAAAVRQDELGAGAERGDSALDDGHTRVPAARGEGRQEGAVVDLVVARDLNASSQRRAQCGHEAAALAGAAPSRVQPERVLVGEEVVQAGAVRRIERDRHRAGGVVPDVVSRRALERGGEARPVAGSLQKERGERGLAELRLGDRREHAGGHPGRAVAPGRRRHNRHFMTVS